MSFVTHVFLGDTRLRSRRAPWHAFAKMPELQSLAPQLAHAVFRAFSQLSCSEEWWNGDGNRTWGTEGKWLDIWVINPINHPFREKHTGPTSSTEISRCSSQFWGFKIFRPLPGLPRVIRNGVRNEPNQALLEPFGSLDQRTRSYFLPKHVGRACDPVIIGSFLWGINQWVLFPITSYIRWVEEILHHLGWLKPYKIMG